MKYASEGVKAAMATVAGAADRTEAHKRSKQEATIAGDESFARLGGEQDINDAVTVEGQADVAGETEKSLKIDNDLGPIREVAEALRDELKIL